MALSPDCLLFRLVPAFVHRIWLVSLFVCPPPSHDDNLLKPKKSTNGGRKLTFKYFIRPKIEKNETKAANISGKLIAAFGFSCFVLLSPMNCIFFLFFPFSKNRESRVNMSKEMLQRRKRTGDKGVAAAYGTFRGTYSIKIKINKHKCQNRASIFCHFSFRWIHSINILMDTVPDCPGDSIPDCQIVIVLCIKGKLRIRRVSR